VGEIGQFILGVVERMEVGPFEISETQEEDFVIYQVSGAAAHRLTSGEGKAQDALQLLSNQAAARLEEEPKRIVVDVEGDPDRREDFLTRIASRAARRASDTGRPVALDPMNGRDRRAIHLALRDEDGIATMSIGEGRYRQVVVVPEGAPEYEEALESVRRASTSES
jgi:spoIIIJ-associated protein